MLSITVTGIHVQAVRTLEDTLTKNIEARATEAQAVNLIPIYYDAARQLLADDTPSRHEDTKHQAIYITSHDNGDDEEPWLSSEEIVTAKEQWMQVSSPLAS